MKAVIFAYVIVALTVWACHAQESGLTLEQYEDSVALAQKMEREAKFMSVSPQAVHTEPVKCELTQQEQSTVDSFELSVQTLNQEWNGCKRLRKLDDTKSRIDALIFYLGSKVNGHSVMSKQEVDHYASILLNIKNTELTGTQFILLRQCGQEKVRANAHLRKVTGELSRINDFIFNLRNERIVIK